MTRNKRGKLEESGVMEANGEGYIKEKGAVDKCC